MSAKFVFLKFSLLHVFKKYITPCISFVRNQRDMKIRKVLSLRFFRLFFLFCAYFKETNIYAEAQHKLLPKLFGNLRKCENS